MGKTVNEGDKKDVTDYARKTKTGHVPFPGALTGCRAPFPLPGGIGGTTGGLGGLMPAATSSVSAGQTSIESAPQRRSSLELLYESVGFFGGSLPFDSVNEVCVASTLRWMVPAAAGASRPRVEGAC